MLKMLSTVIKQESNLMRERHDRSLYNAFPTSKRYRFIRVLTIFVTTFARIFFFRKKLCLKISLPLVMSFGKENNFIVF